MFPDMALDPQAWGILALTPRLPTKVGGGGGAGHGNLVAFIRNDGNTDHQFDYFVPHKVSGLTQAGLLSLNRLIEPFVHFVLGAQVNVVCSILGDGGRAIEAQSEFLELLEDAVRQHDLAESVHRYQLTIDKAKGAP